MSYYFNDCDKKVFDLLYAWTSASIDHKVYRLENASECSSKPFGTTKYSKSTIKVFLLLWYIVKWYIERKRLLACFFIPSLVSFFIYQAISHHMFISIRLLPRKLRKDFYIAAMNDTKTCLLLGNAGLLKDSRSEKYRPVTNPNTTAFHVSSWTRLKI